MVVYEFSLTDGTNFIFTVNTPSMPYSDDNTGHVKISYYEGAWRQTKTLEFDVTNTLGFLPALDVSVSTTAPSAGANDYGWNMVNGLVMTPVDTNKYVVSNIDTSNWYTSSVNFFALGMIFSYPRYGVAKGNGQLVEVTIEANFPLFFENPVDYTFEGGRGTNYSYNSIDDSLVYEVANGNYDHISQAANYESGVTDIPADKTYFIRSTLKVNGTPTTSKGYCFQISPDAKICLYQDDSPTGDGSPNLHLIISPYPCLVKGYSEPDEDYTESSNPDTEYWHSGYWRDINTGINYTGICSTNIPIFRGQENAQKYLDGELSESDALNGGSLSNKDSTIGNQLQGTDIPTVNLSTSGVGTYIYALSETQIKTLMSNYLYVTDPTLLSNISDGLWLWGNNPIDFFIDCYYIPFDITNFYTTHNADMKFGTYRFESSQGWSTFPVVQETNGQRLTLFNTTFEGVYGDWRDYSQFEYDLFLPFYGFFKLDLYKYLNHTVRCEMMFDVTTHNLRYYLFVDDVITDRIDSSVGINLPLMSSDMVNKAKSDRQARRESDRTAYRAMGAFLTGGLAVAGGIASGNASYAVNGGTSAITSVIDAKYNLDALADKVHENATQHVEGAYSSSMNIYDIRYAYLRITESELIMPDKLNELYGYPSYYMGSASALSGYCEISDIRLKSFTGTVEELNALKGALREGVIL